MLTVPGPSATAGAFGAAEAEPDPGLVPRLLALVLGSPTTTTTPTTVASTTTTTTGATTTTTAAPVAKPTAPPPALTAPVAGITNTQVGIASWYNDKAASCAHRTAPIGTKLNVTNLVNGKRMQCTVTNRGPYSPGRIVDLSDEGFAQIAPLSQGLAEVRVEW